MQSEALKFDRITKVYQSRQVALADVSFSLPFGSTTGLLGANGSGKSTAIRIALGLITPTAGCVETFGERMHPGSRLLRQRIGFLADDPAYPKDLTAIGYLQFVGKCFGLERQDLAARMGTLLRAVGLTDDAGRKVGTYSTGMRTRLGIAASLMNDPELLIWDEPTAGLDPISRRQTLELLENLRGKKTVVLSSHILGDIDRVCDRLIVLNCGQLLFDGERSKLEDLLPETNLDLRVSGPVARFCAELRREHVREGFARDGDHVRVSLAQGESVSEVVEAMIATAKATECRIEAIQSTGRRLEDAYLKLITEDEFRGFLRIDSKENSPST